MTQDLNTLICLFHHQDLAQAALEEILEAGIPEANVTLIGGPGSQIAASESTLLELNVPAKDVEHLLTGINGGGAVLAVSALSQHADRVEAIFANHKAGKIDEAVVADDMSAHAVPFALPPATMQPEPLEAVPPYDPLLPSELEREGDDLVLVTTKIGADGMERIENLQPIAVTPAQDFAATEDVDPRELGLDARMKPSVVRGQVQ